jgi:hypothetical protein
MVLSNYKKAMLEYGRSEVFRKAIAKDVLDKRETVMKDAVAKAHAVPPPRGGILGSFF